VIPRYHRTMRWLVCSLVVVACGSSGSKMTNPDAHRDGSSRSDGAAGDDAPAGPNHCLARDCGPDGAGGSCGECGGMFQCDDNLGLCIPYNGADVGVTFGTGCWYVCPTGQMCGDPGTRYQAMPFQLQSAYPVEATLYFDDNCDPAGGTDNLNDTGAATPTDIDLEWFIHHPDTKPSSGVWWAGHHSSGCVDYTNAPDCQ